MSDDRERKDMVSISEEDLPIGNLFSQLLLRLASLPLELALQVLRYGLYTLRSFSPQLVPIVICTLIIPFLVFFSLTAGLVVWRSSAIGWEADLYLNYGDGVPPYAEVPLPLMAARQPYDISLHLVIPAMESNYDLGNFMTTLTLLSRSNQTLTTVRKPTMILPPPPTLFGRRRSAPILLEINLLESYAASTSGLLARVEIGRRDGWKSLGRGEGREVSVSSASLQGTLRYKGPRGLMTRFPFLTAVVSAGSFFTVSTLILAGCLVPIMLGRLSDTSYPGMVSPAAEEGKDLPPTDEALRKIKPNTSRSRSQGGEDDEKSIRRRKSSSSLRRGRSGARTPDIKQEIPETIISSAGPSTPVPLRRRQSRPFESITS